MVECKAMMAAGLLAVWVGGALPATAQETGGPMLAPASIDDLRPPSSAPENASPLIAQDGTLLVERVALDCVLEHIDVYRAQPQDPVIVVLADCPPRPSVATKDDVPPISAMLPSLVPQNVEAEAQPEAVLILTKQELDCLAAHAGGGEAADDLMRLPRSLCD